LPSPSTKAPPVDYAAELLLLKNEIKELSQASVLVAAIVRGENKKDEKMYFPRETAN